MSDLHRHEVQLFITVDHDAIDYTDSPIARSESVVQNALDDVDGIAPVLLNTVHCEEDPELEEEVEEALDESSVESVREAFKTVPDGVITGIEEISEGETADGDDLDDALSWGDRDD